MWRAGIDVDKTIGDLLNWELTIRSPIWGFDIAGTNHARID